MDRPKLSDREAALIEAARRELASSASPKPDPPTISRPTPGAEAPLPNTAAARIAALTQAEQEETSRRKRRLRQYGVVIPAVIVIAATLWVATAIFRHIRL